MKIRLFLLSLVAIAVVACNNDDNPDPTECPALWTLLNHQSTVTTNITNGNLVISSEMIELGAAISLFQEGLVGDFDLAMTATDFKAGTNGQGAFMQLVASYGTENEPKLLVAGIGNVTPIAGGLQLGAARVELNQLVSSNYIPIPANSATFTLNINRTGQVITITAQSGTSIATIVEDLAVGNMDLGIQFGSNFENVTGDSGITITGITVTGGGGTVKSDSFDCNSIK